MTAAATCETPALIVDPRFAAVYAEHVDHVWRSLRRLGVATPELDDAVQETFLVALRRWDDVRDGASWRAWLFGIARRVASHHRRGRARRLRLVDSVAHEVRPTIELEDALALRDAARLVDHFLSTQPPRRREVFILAELEGFTGIEIADALGISANTVGSRLRSARESFARFSSSLRAREHGDRERWNRRALLRAAQHERMPAASRERVMSLLALPIAKLPVMTMAGVGALGVAKAIAISVALGIAMLGSVAGGAALLLPAASTGGIDDEPTIRSASPRDTKPRTIGVPQPAPPHASAAVETLAPVTIVVPSRSLTHANDRRRAKPSIRSAAPSPSSAAPPADATALRAELVLAERIRNAIRADAYATVLELVAQHRERFPTAELAVERDVHEIAALCGLGRAARAHARIAAFAIAHPGATIPAGIRNACGSAAQKPTTSTASGQQE